MESCLFTLLFFQILKVSGRISKVNDESNLPKTEIGIRIDKRLAKKKKKGCQNERGSETDGKTH